MQPSLNGQEKAPYRYGLKPGSAEELTTENCGCVRMVGSFVIDYCQRHVLNEILHAITKVEGSIINVYEALDTKAD